MPCTNPMTGYRNERGRLKLFPAKDTSGNIWKHAITVACGNCLSCTLKKSAEWAVRMMHETLAHPDEQAHFVTLTYSPDHLPPGSSLQKEDLKLFFVRMRKAGYKFRYLACGEYGEKNNRPHYHFCAVGKLPNDLEPFFTSFSGKPQHTSAIYDKLWQHRGHVTVGEVTSQSAAYVARYIVKKAAITEDDLVEPEFRSSSRKPALGLAFLEKHWRDIYSTLDAVQFDDKFYRPPTYYDKWMRKHHPEEWDRICKARQAAHKDLKAHHLESIDAYQAIIQQRLQREL